MDRLQQQGPPEPINIVFNHGESTKFDVLLQLNGEELRYSGIIAISTETAAAVAMLMAITRGALYGKTIIDVKVQRWF